MENELASAAYRSASKIADAMVSAGKIAAKDRDRTWANIVKRDLSKYNLKVPKGVLSRTGQKCGNASFKSATGAMTGSATSMAGQATKQTLRVGAPIAVGIFLGQSAHTAYKYSKGQISSAEALRKTAESAASNGGGLGGAALGAALGTLILPGVGTVIGSVVGGAAASFAGEKVVQKIMK